MSPWPFPLWLHANRSVEYSNPIGQTCTKSERLGTDVMIVMVCRPPYFTVNHTMTFSCFVLVEGSPSTHNRASTVFSFISVLQKKKNRVIQRVEKF